MPSSSRWEAMLARPVPARQGRLASLPRRRPAPGAGGGPRRVPYPRPVSTSRLETFADGVFAIAATLLILSVDGQVSNGAPHLGHDLLQIWPSYAAYVVSFVTIGVIWVNHHTLMN